MKYRVLVTGANGGFGALISETLLKAGHQVVAGMRDPSDKNLSAASALRQLGAHVVELDVTSDLSVQHAVNEAKQALGNLDVVVNNAGIGVFGLQEAFTPEQLEKLFAVNVTGVQRVTREVLPTFRDNGSGLIINISSLLGRITLPFYGLYNASKWALEALSENYRTELSVFGVEVAIVEPGGFPTPFFANVTEPDDTARVKQYGEFAKAPDAAKESFAQVLESNPQQNPQLVADAVLSVLDAPVAGRPFRTTVDTLGIGDAVEQYNLALDKTTKQIFSAFGMEDMLQVKIKPESTAA